MINRLLLGFACGICVCVPLLASAAETADKNPPAQEQVIQPELDRRDVKLPHIDVDDIEVGFYVGTLSIENFNSQSVKGLRLAYHVTEDFFIEGATAKSIISDEFFRSRAFPITGFDKQEEDLTYHNISLGYNVLPGEIFLGRRWAMASAFYVIGGVGTTKFAKQSHSTFNFGGGYRILLNDWWAVHLDMRDYVFNSDLLGQNKRTNNFEATFGMTVFF
ncbi:MAG: outer membrane beta-barrel domain-containing protein [Gammaproteobacteria bacterium]|nr:outer membrane beta-barrel domain-containing protein [Gammaproteobacteria bacterium]